MSYAESMTHYHESVESVTEAIHSLFEDRGGVEFAQEALKNMRESYQSIKKPFFTSNLQKSQFDFLGELTNKKMCKKCTPTDNEN